MNKVVLGVISTTLAIMSWFIFWWLSVVEIVVGVAGLATKVQITDDASRSYDTAGRVLNSVGITLGGIGLIIFLISLAALV